MRSFGTKTAMCFTIIHFFKFQVVLWLFFTTYAFHDNERETLHNMRQDPGRLLRHLKS